MLGVIPTPTVTLTAPNGGENWMRTTSQNITWSSNGVTGTVKLLLYQNLSLIGTIAQDLAVGSGYYSWTVGNLATGSAPVGSNYKVRIQTTNNVLSDDTDGTFTISEIEIVSVPSTLSGPVFGSTGVSYTYTTGGAVSSQGHTLQYKFAWGDVSDADWLAVGTTTASHSWAAAGTYNVRAKARCATHTAVESPWSNVLSVVIPVTGKATCDYNGDGRSDIAVWRPGSGYWFIKDQGQYQWGMPGDIPVPGDYNGDGTTDIAVWRPSSGTWFVNFPTGAPSAWQWGQAGDIPVPGDYNGDGTIDIAVWRPSNGYWFVMGQGQYQWGMIGDIPVPGDYNGDGTTDIAIWRPSNGYWFVMGQGQYQWGTNGDIPVPGDYNGDGTTDIAIWRPSNGFWFVRGQGNTQWGINGDKPLCGDYNGDGRTDITVWRPSDGYWFVMGQGQYQWGSDGDVPLD